MMMMMPMRMTLDTALTDTVYLDIGLSVSRALSRRGARDGDDVDDDDDNDDDDDDCDDDDDDEDDDDADDDDDDDAYSLLFEDHIETSFKSKCISLRNSFEII